MEKNGNGPLVSVVMIVYNQEGCVGRAIESVLAQRTNFAVELLISDDCSTDSTAAVCRRYAESNPAIKFVRNARNKGLVRNYYDTIRRTTGKYIADLAGDDYWTDPTKLQAQADLMEAKPDVVLCHAAWCMDRSGDVVSPAGFFMPNEAREADGRELVLKFLNHQRGEWFVHLCTALYRRDAVLPLMERHPQFFDDSSLPCEDLQLICLLATVGRFAYLPQPVLNYSVGQATISSDENPAKVVSFTGRVIDLTVELAHTLGYSYKDIASYWQHDLNYVVVTAFRGKCFEFIPRIDGTIAKAVGQLRPLLKTRIGLSLMRIPVLRSLLASLYVALK